MRVNHLVISAIAIFSVLFSPQLLAQLIDCEVYSGFEEAQLKGLGDQPIAGMSNSDQKIEVCDSGEFIEIYKIGELKKLDGSVYVILDHSHTYKYKNMGKKSDLEPIFETKNRYVYMCFKSRDRLCEQYENTVFTQTNKVTVTDFKRIIRFIAGVKSNLTLGGSASSKQELIAKILSAKGSAHLKTARFIDYSSPDYPGLHKIIVEQDGWHWSAALNLSSKKIVVETIGEIVF